MVTDSGLAAKGAAARHAAQLLGEDHQMLCCGGEGSANKYLFYYKFLFTIP